MADFSLADFEVEGVITTGLFAPIALEFLPDGRMLVLEKGGQILIADPETGNFETYLDISGIVNSANERGLLDIAIPEDFDPDPASGKNNIYLYYTRSAETNAAVIGEFTHIEGSGGLTSTADVGSEIVLWTDTDPATSCCHYGGGLDFGPDGKIWLTSSDKFNTSNSGEGGERRGEDNVSVNVESTSGKIIRINRDGTIPDGTDGWPANPYVDGVVDGPYPTTTDTTEFGAELLPDPSIWAYGLRNPFRAEWDLERELLFIGEVGGNQGGSTDDIHIASLDQAGAFYGWNFYEGGSAATGGVVFEPAGAITNFDPADFPQPDTDLADPSSGDYFSAPIYDIPHSSLTGGFVYNGDAFPSEFKGVYFFGNYEENYIQFLDLDAAGTTVLGAYDFIGGTEIQGSASNIVFLAEGPDGALYYINYASTGGQVQRVVYDGAGAPDIDSFVVTDPQGDPDDGAGLNSPLDVTFTAIVSDEDSPLSELTYTLNFGDGSSVATGAPDPVTGAISVAHTYSAEAFYSATLSVSDGIATALSSPILITVGDPNDAPTYVQQLNANPAFGEAGQEVTFTATVNDVDTDDPLESLVYVIDFGDGTPTVTGSPDSSGIISLTHTYTTDSDFGGFNAFMTISDGEAVPVRSDTVPILIGDVSQLPVTNGLVFQVESYIKVGLNGDTVTEWLDESGRGNNLTAFGDPQYVQDATPSGLPAIVLDGDGDYLSRMNGEGSTLDGFSQGNEPRTMFFVVDYEDVTDGVYAGLSYGNDADNQAFGLTLDGRQDDFTIQGWGGSNDRRTDIDGVIDPATGEQRGFVSHAVTFDGTTYRHFANGEEIDSGNKAYNTILEQLIIGGNFNGGTVPLSVAAAFIYDRALSADEFNAVEQYIQSTFLDDSVSPPANTPPTAQDDLYAATAGVALTVAAGIGLLSNDIDDGGLIVAEVNAQPVSAGTIVALANGTLTINPDGSFSYQSVQGFIGTETFTYIASDGEFGDQATVDIDVTAPPANTPPTAQDDIYTATTGTALKVLSVGNGVLGNDVDDGPLLVANVNGQPVSMGTVISLDNGSLTIDPDGTFIYVSDQGFSGTETFTYVASDGEFADQATVNIDVTPPSSFSPTGDTRLVGYFESDINVIVENGVVTGWLSGAGTNLDLTASGNPVLVSNATPSGQSAISLDGVGDWLDRDLTQDTGTDLPTGDQSRSMYFV
ncbi:MAG: PQQ-dependent sugar dehydrogenase, partial [Pseudomonadota bacterium]